MKNLTATLCLTLAVLLGSVGVSASADFQKGLTAVQSGDFATALREWTPLAILGNAAAQYNLGVMYDKGQGVTQDDKIAIKWWKLAAKQGYASAHNNLGFMYANGKGIPQDYILGYMWWYIAASNGHKDAVVGRDEVSKLMTPTQIEKAQNLARECIRKKYKGC